MYVCTSTRHGCTYVHMNVRTYLCESVCMYVCMCAREHLLRVCAGPRMHVLQAPQSCCKAPGNNNAYTRKRNLAVLLKHLSQACIRRQECRELPQSLLEVRCPVGKDISPEHMWACSGDVASRCSLTTHEVVRSGFTHLIRASCNHKLST